MRTISKRTSFVYGRYKAFSYGITRSDWKLSSNLIRDNFTSRGWRGRAICTQDKPMGNIELHIGWGAFQLYMVNRVRKSLNMRELKIKLDA